MSFKLGFQPAQYWIQETTDGKALFIVFYTLKCQWGKCTGCPLPLKSSDTHITYKQIMAQIDWIFKFGELDLRLFKKVIISNNGSVFDQDTFSTTALLYLISQINLKMPNVTTVTMETRPAYIDEHELDILSRALKEGNHKTELEIAIGMEAYSSYIRNNVFNKGLNLSSIDLLMLHLSRYEFKLKVYFMLKPINMTSEEAIDDVKKGIDYLYNLAVTYNTHINMHLNPTYVGLGTKLEKEFKNGKYQLCTINDIKSAILYAKNIDSKLFSIYVGIDDEGLACENGGIDNIMNSTQKNTIEVFNKTGNYSVLDLL